MRWIAAEHSPGKGWNRVKVRGWNRVVTQTPVRPRRHGRGREAAGLALLAGLAAVLALGCSEVDSTRLESEREGAILPVEPMPGSGSEPAIAPPAVATPPTEVDVPAGPVGPPDTIYEREHLIEVRVEMDPAEWEQLSFEGIGMGEILFPASGFRLVPEYTHFAATVTVDGIEYPNVDIRKKGYIGSLSVIRPSLKLDFERRQGQELVLGNRRMTLNNDLQDPSHARQCLSYEMFRSIGLPASRCNYAHVVVNGVDLGIYSHVEAVAKPMLRRYFDDVDGNLYEGQLSDFNVATNEYLELQSNEDLGERADVQAVIDALALPDAEVVAALGELVNLDQFFDFWALETLLGHWDGYSGNSNNFFAYHDPTSGKFHFIPWGTDQTFVGDNPNDNLPYQITVYAAGTLSNRLYAIPEQRARYRQRLAELNDTLWNVPQLLERVEQLSRLAPDASREALTRLRSYIRAHGEELRTALSQPAPDWPVAPPPQPGDACQGTFGDISGTFSTVWGTLADVDDVVATGSTDGDVAVELDGAAFVGDFRGRAGEDGFLPDTATLRFVAPREDGFYLLMDLAFPIEVFEAGYHPLHSFESFGLIGLFEPVSGQFINLGLLGDGGVTLEEASLQPGGRVSGRLSAKASYFVCASTVLAFAPPAPPAEGEPGAGAGGGGGPPGEDEAGGEDGEDGETPGEEGGGAGGDEGGEAPEEPGEEPPLESTGDE